MAGNIQKVNLSQLLSEIGEYQSFVANDLSISCINEIQNDLMKLTKYWTGKRVNSIINVWNNKANSISEVIKYFRVTITGILYEIYNQYNSMEKGVPADNSIQWSQSLYEVKKISLTAENTIKYDKANVEKITKNIENLCLKATTILNKLVTKLDSMQAYSDSLKSVATNYKSNATKLKSLLDSISNNINTEIKKAVQDVNITEQYNEKDAKRAATTTK